MTASELRPDIPLDDLIDRLVDGELSPEELRPAVARLDATPDGWRRCAIAFLAAQSLRDALRCDEEPIPRMELPRLAGATASETSPRARPRRGSLPARPAMAAAVALAAFTLGWVGHGWRSGGPSPRGMDVISHASSPAPASPDEGAATDLARSDPTPSPRVVPASATLPVPAIREVARIPIGDGMTPGAEVPILAGSGIDERWLSAQPPPVSDYQRALWERHGYQLEQRRRLVSVPLADGRRAAIPVDQVRVRYVGHDPL